MNKEGGYTEKIVSGFIERMAEAEVNEEDEEQKGQEQEPEPEMVFSPDEIAETIVAGFFDRFLINSEGSA